MDNFDEQNKKDKKRKNNPQNLTEEGEKGGRASSGVYDKDILSRQENAEKLEDDYT